jgi:hypothetical protein
MNTIEKMYGYLIGLYVHFTKQYDQYQQIELADLSNATELPADAPTAKPNVAEKPMTYSIPDPMRMFSHIQL